MKRLSSNRLGVWGITGKYLSLLFGGIVLILLTPLLIKILIGIAIIISTWAITQYRRNLFFTENELIVKRKRKEEHIPFNSIAVNGNIFNYNYIKLKDKKILNRYIFYAIHVDINILKALKNRNELMNTNYEEFTHLLKYSKKNLL